MKEFLHLSVRDGTGHTVLHEALTVCPNTLARARLGDDGPLSPTYPSFCGGMPFTKGLVWGIDDDWVVSPTADHWIRFEASARWYVVRAWIDPLWADALGVPADDARTTVRVEVVRQEDEHSIASAERLFPPSAPNHRLLITTWPDRDSLPDLMALPAWGIGTHHQGGRDLLTFNATEWNAGPGTMVIEGFRSRDEDLMDAFQYFLVDGEPVGRAPIGQLEFSHKHQHWHFEQFTKYSLLDADGETSAVSKKRSWCLGNTDGIDLTVPNANWSADGGDIFSMCGGPESIWIREVLDVGWGDTYAQSVAGQAFDITNLPNGDYWLRVQVNPTGSIFEASSENNVQDRLIRLRGRPGRRWVIVPRWHGIDTEGNCWGCH